MKYRVNVEVGRAASLKLMAEIRRREKVEGRGTKYPMWRIVDELLNTLPEPDEATIEDLAVEEQPC